MIHLIWSIINGIIFLYFLYLIVGYIAKGKKIFKPQFKVISIFIMVIGIVHIISASNSEKNTNQLIITEDYDRQSNTKVKEVILEENLTFDINMLVTFSVEQDKLIPIESNSFLTGVVSGYEWELKSIQTDTYQSDKEAEFVANGILKWNLFGINVFSEAKTFRGTMK